MKKIDTRQLETLLGYNTRSASLSIINHFIKNMVEFDLRPVDFSVISLIGHNPEITSRELCHTLNVLPPNMVLILKNFEIRDLIIKTPHPTDGRAIGLSLSKQGKSLMEKAEIAAYASDRNSASKLTETEHKTLIKLLKKVYSPS